MFTASVNFNRRAERWAVRHNKPIVGNGDVHRLRQLGTTYSLIDAAPDPDDICGAIVAGRVRVESRPLTWIEAAHVVSAMWFTDCVMRHGPDREPTIHAPHGPVISRRAESLRAE
jgi:hypothetical protein